MDKAVFFHISIEYLGQGPTNLEGAQVHNKEFPELTFCIKVLLLNKN